MGLSTKWLAAALCGVLMVPAFASSVQKKNSKKARKQQVARAELPPVPLGPLPPLPLDTVPAVAPEVNYEDGNLSILARNSSLSDILKAVGQHTGATIDVPSAATERVVTKLGPGPARDVLASLLNGSKYNYVVLGSPSDPNAISKIILTAKAAGGPDAPSPGSPSAATIQYQRPVFQGIPQPAQVTPMPQPVAEGDGEDLEPEPDAEEGNDPAAEQQNEGDGGEQAQPAVPGQNAPKTPEQLLQELQRQQQLLLQQYQGQQPQVPNPPNQTQQPPQQ